MIPESYKNQSYHLMSLRGRYKKSGSWWSTLLRYIQPVRKLSNILVIEQQAIQPMWFIWCKVHVFVHWEPFTKGVFNREKIKLAYFTFSAVVHMRGCTVSRMSTSCCHRCHVSLRATQQVMQNGLMGPPHSKEIYIKITCHFKRELWDVLDFIFSIQLHYFCYSILCVLEISAWRNSLFLSEWFSFEWGRAMAPKR